MSLDEKNPDTNEVTADNSSDEKDINNIDEESVFGRNSAQSDSFVSDESDMGDMGSDEINLSSSDEAVKKDVDDDFKKKKGSVKRKALLLLLFLLLGGAAIIIIPKLGSSKAGEDDVDNISGQIYQGLPEGFDEAELLKKMQEKTDKSAFTINVNSRPIFANGSAKA